MTDTEIPRGGCVSVFLVFSMIANACTAILYALLSVKQTAQLHVPIWVLLFLAVVGIINLCAAIAVWRWRKWGVYACAASALVIFPINLVLHVSPVVAAIGLLGPAILIALVRPIWAHLK